MTRSILGLSLGAVALLMLALSLGIGGPAETAATEPGFTQGNIDCDGSIDANDVLEIVLFAAGVANVGSAGGCPLIGTSSIGGQPWGDLNCSDATDAGDATPLLYYLGGVPQHFDGCVDVGQPIGGPTITPSPTPFQYICPDFDWNVGAGSATWGCTSATRVELHVTDGEHVLLKDGVTLTDTHIEADVSTPNREAALVFRAQDGDNAYVAVFIPEGTPFASGVQLYKKIGGAYFVLTTAAFNTVVHSGEVAHFEVDAVGTNIKVKVNGDTLIDLNDAEYSSGKVGLRAFATVGQPCDSLWDNIAFNEIS